MTDKDWELLKKAGDYNFEYSDIEDLIKIADTQECKDRLHQIAMKKYHEEEYRAGML